MSEKEGGGGRPGGDDKEAEWWNSDSDDDSEEQRKRNEAYADADELYDEKEDDRIETERTLHGPAGDIRLSCPSCFIELCSDCQQHERFKTQWRAIFVQNCVVQSDNAVASKVAEEKVKEEDAVEPVECEQCGATVGVRDSEEIYHFFNVVPSV